MGSMARYPATKRRSSSDSVHTGSSICSNRLDLWVKPHDVVRLTGTGSNDRDSPIIRQEFDHDPGGPLLTHHHRQPLGLIAAATPHSASRN